MTHVQACDKTFLMIALCVLEESKGAGPHGTTLDVTFSN
jgi:hypothetical protein